MGTGETSDAVVTIAAGQHLALVRRGPWEFMQRTRGTAAAMALAWTDAAEVVLVEQTRIPVGGRVIELPAGLVGDESDAPEDPMLAMARELVEETGFAAARLEVLGHGPASPGSSSEMITLFRATGLRRVGQGGGLAGSESIVVHVVARATLPDWLRVQEARGALVDPRIWAALFLDQITPPGGPLGPRPRAPRGASPRP